MKLFYALFLILTGMLLDSKQATAQLKVGTWRGVIEMQKHQLPFNFRVEKDERGGFDVYLKNAREELLLDEVVFKNDSVDFVLHVFDAELRASIKGDSLKGFFILNYRNDYRLPFHAVFNQDFRFTSKKQNPAVDFSGKYQVVFTSERDTIPAVGMFSIKGNYAEGTFLTPTGDYRFLEGNIIDDTLFLSTFDGNHAFLFKAWYKNDTLQGDYWSGKNHYENWKAVKAENASIPDPESLTYLKEGYDRLEFSFPDVNGKQTSLKDYRYENKVVILQLFGTWCPNCMDETKFLSEWYNTNKNRGIEVLGLAYERKPDFAYASDRVKKLKEKWDVKYELVIAGVNDKVKAAETLPALNKVVAFPTTIFIGKDGKVKYIHTGFEGPGTGVYFLQFVDRFNEIVNELLAEELAFKKK